MDARTIAADLLYGWRTLRRSPGFAVAVVLTIAVGIGANAAVLGIMDAAFMRRIRVPDAERLLLVQCVASPRARGDYHPCAWPEWRDLSLKRIDGIDGLAGYAMSPFRLGGEYAGLEPYGAFVSGNYFAVLGARAQLGRTILPHEDEPGNATPVVVISDYLWRNTFGGDASIVGRHIRIGSGDFTIVGVMPAGFTGVHPEGRTDIWAPYTTQRLATNRDTFSDRRARTLWHMIARMGRDADAALVSASLGLVQREMAAAHPDLYTKTVYRTRRLDRMVDWRAASNALVTFLVAWGMVALVHVVACSNVAAMLLARAATRRRELGIRLCLGASRSRIVLHALAEPVILSLMGGVGGVLVARWLTDLATGMWFLSALDPGLDVRSVAIVGVVAIATALLCGLGPALASARRDPLEVLRGAASLRRGRGEFSTGTVIVVQVALSLVLLAQATILLGKVRREADVPLGYEARQLVMARLGLAGERTQAADGHALYDEAIALVGRVPGVTAVSAAAQGPLEFGGVVEEVEVPGHDYQENEPRETSIVAIAPAYFTTIGARMRSGREFVPTDRALVTRPRESTVRVVVVNEAFVRRYWLGKDVLGRTVSFRGRPATVVGVVTDLRDMRLSLVVPRVYIPMLQVAQQSFSLVARVGGDPHAAVPRVRSALLRLEHIDPPRVRTIDDARDDQLLVARGLGFATLACAGLALLLTAIGLYGVVSMWATERRPEIGVRLALGARASHVYATLLSGIGRLTLIGCALGIVAAVALVRVEQARYGGSLSFDAVPVIVALTAFLGITGVAVLSPARRASLMQPVEVLRERAD